MMIKTHAKNAQAARPLPPGSTIGILGNGQLGRMLAIAAAQLGLRTHVYADASGPAFDVAPRSIVAAYDDRAALAAFAQSVDVVTYEFENVPLDAAEYLSGFTAVRPGAKALAVAQDRLGEKTFLSKLGLPVAPFAKIGDARELAEALDVMDGPAILKTRRLGYDGKGQIGIDRGDDLAAALQAMAGAPVLLEKRIRFLSEISVLAVRAMSGELAYYDCPLNQHAGGILRRSSVPADLPTAHIEAARAMAAAIAEALDYVGVIAVELFYLPDQADQPLIINEFAPRVHNSGHWTLDACAVSQFENHIRAVAGWPLGSTQRHSDAVMENLIGRQVDDWQDLGSDPGLVVHIYGKHQAREGRKMGHLTRLKPKTGS